MTEAQAVELIETEIRSLDAWSAPGCYVSMAERNRHKKLADALRVVLSPPERGGGEEDMASVAGVPCPQMDTHTPSDLDKAWRAVDVLGAPDTACTTDEERAYCRAIGDACREIEKLGGRWS